MVCFCKELQRLNIKVAESMVAGSLDSNPFLQGLLCQCLETIDKQSRGVSTTRGRHVQRNEVESRLIEDAALSFAIAGGNTSLAKSLGQKARTPAVHCDALPLHGLPNPVLALSDQACLAENLQLLDKLFPRDPVSPVRRLVAAIDHTYLTRTFMQGKIRGVRGLLGGPWSVEAPEPAFKPFDNLQPGVLKTEKASLMLEVVCWDPLAAKRTTYSLASAPMTLKRKKDIPDDQTLVKQGNLAPALCVCILCFLFFTFQFFGAVSFVRA